MCAERRKANNLAGEKIGEIIKFGELNEKAKNSTLSYQKNLNPIKKNESNIVIFLALTIDYLLQNLKSNYT